MTGSRNTPGEPARIYLFGPFRIDAERRELTRNGRGRRIQPRALDLLIYFVRHPGRIITREEATRSLWRDTVVDFEHGLNTQMGKVRPPECLTLGDRKGTVDGARRPS